MSARSIRRALRAVAWASALCAPLACATPPRESPARSTPTAAPERVALPEPLPTSRPAEPVASAGPESFPAAPRQDRPSAPPSERATESPSDFARESAQPPWSEARETPSRGGRYLVRWRTTPDPIARGATFALDAWVFDARDARAVLGGVRLAVDADMPEHRHGMNRVPRVAARPDGGFHVEGLLFHMAGRWELDFDVTRGAVTERAAARIDLE